MTFDFPLRVRCIEGSSFFRRGEEYRVLRLLGVDMCVIDGDQQTVASRHRFKPIIRVKV